MFKEKESEESVEAIDSRPITPKSEKHLWVRHAQVFRAVRKCADVDRVLGKLEIISGFGGRDILAAFQVHDKSVPMKEGNTIWFGMVNANGGKRGSRYFGMVAENEIPVVFDRFAKVMHIQSLDLQRKTEAAFELFAIRCTNYEERASQLKCRTLTKDEAEWLFYKASLNELIGPHMLRRMRKVFQQLTKTERRSAWTVCLAFSKTLIEFAPFPDKPPTDLFSLSWQFVRMVSSTKMVPMGGGL